MDKIIYNKILINKKLKSFVDKLIVNLSEETINNIIELDEIKEQLNIKWVNNPTKKEELLIKSLWKGPINHIYDGLFYNFN